MQSVPSPQQLQQLILTLKPGQALEPEKLIVWLSEHGYNRLEQVEVPGDFAVRGGIIDVYLPGERGFAELEKRTREGIPLAPGTLSRLVELATKQSIEVPDSFR